MNTPTNGSGGSRIDPLADFRLGLTQERAFAPGEIWWDVLVELSGISLDKLAAEANRDDPSNGNLFIPNLYSRDRREAQQDVQYPTVYAKADFIRTVNQSDNQLGVKRLVLGAQVPADQFDPRAKIMPADLPIIPVAAGTVVTAVIDNGIAFGHELFRKADLNKSRVEFAWIMDAIPNPAGALPISRGRVLTREEIDDLLAENMSSGLLDEDRFYRKCGLIDYTRQGLKQPAMRVSHGTHVMGIAAGYPPGERDETRPIICVQLPTDVTMDVTGAELLPALGEAIEFVKRQAERFRLESDNGQVVPLVVNFSYGNFAGPHDGTGLIDVKLDQEFQSTSQRPVQLALPAGNGNLSRTHAEVTFRNAGETVRLNWRIQPDDLTASYVEIWLPYLLHPAESIAVRVACPGGPTSNPVTTSPGSSSPISASQGQTVGRVQYAAPAVPTNRGCILIAANPTFGTDATNDLAPAGVWMIEIENHSLTDTDRVQIWIRRDETLPGFSQFGRQSYFDNEDYVRFNASGAPVPADPPGSTSIVTRRGTLSGFACGEQPAVLAGYVEAGGRLAGYSAAGPISTAFNALSPTRTGPDAAQVSDDTPVLRGVLSAGSRSGSLVALNGTSVAAPQAARWMSDRLASGLIGNRLAVNAKGASDDNDPPPLTRAGGGRMQRTVRFGPSRKA